VVRKVKDFRECLLWVSTSQDEGGVNYIEMAQIKLSIRRLPKTGEYKILYRINGRLSESKGYYTSDMNDAMETLESMGLEALRQGNQVELKLPKGITYEVGK